MNNQLKSSYKSKKVKGEFVKFNNDTFYKITNSDEMRPFFMSILSDSNHWLFVSSNGGISAGRKNSEFSVFPYYTDDKITESSEVTGSKSILRISSPDGEYIWEPFSIRQAGIYKTTRNLYKNTYGNKVVFEEINLDLNLTFRYQWNTSNEFGFVKKSEIINDSNSSITLSILDGVQNILPFGVPSATQNQVSNLVDAYKKSELEKEAGLGIYALSAIIVDKAEPSEALKANIAWSLGLENPTYLLSSLQLEDFRRGHALRNEIDVRAEKGAYFLNSTLELEANSQKEWMFVLNTNQDHVAIVDLIDQITNDKDIKNKIEEDILKGTSNLKELGSASDGIQLTSDKSRDTRHFANTLFNIMRGGIFDDNYKIEKWDFKNYLGNANTEVYSNKIKLIDALPEQFTLADLKEIAEESDDADFKRLCLEYMPLKFSRRHGDPSRPWNKFSINTRSEIDGSKILDYEGNWRDIFQNWEALVHSYPEFIDSMIHKFLNASTFDGYNPYRVTKDGFDWETIEPDDPWSYIGYWGDHQIIYLLKFLEFSEDHYPGNLANLFDENIFVYANVPYKIKRYQNILENPKDTIEFDDNLDKTIREKREILGADAALLMLDDGSIYKVNFIEKILATVLAKISNYIPEGGIWLNTQRPEWNDANNALVGNGVSMVTLYYLRRFLNFFQSIFDTTDKKEVEISKELFQFYEGVFNTLQENRDLVENTISDKDRKNVLDGLGIPASNYREQIYKHTFSGEKKKLSISELKKFVEVTLKHLEHSIEINERDDGLYHAYNLMTLENENEISISYLSEMLEGQVAVLSSGYLESKQVVGVLDAMKNSKLFREDQYSYLLYPNKILSRFMQKNTVPKKAVEDSELLKQMLKDGNHSIVKKDAKGVYHFNGNFNNAESLKSVLSDIKDSKYGHLVEKEKKSLLATFEDVFNHKSFTGRSGTFYGYEGLGSIYWHMVSKLQLAVQECCFVAIESNSDEVIIGKLLDHYYEINEGIGVHKSPELYGAFPTDPYSHTPQGKGAQQPGMTGQVKEDILARIGELGVFVEEGQIVFKPSLLRKTEFLDEPKTYNFININKQLEELKIDKDSIVFCYCQVPIIYSLSEHIGINVKMVDASETKIQSMRLDKAASEEIFKRTGKVKQVIVNIQPSILK